LTMMAFVLEQLVDELAAQLGLSPLEMRQRNVARTGQPMADDTPWPEQELHRLLEAARDHPLLTAPKGEGEGVGVAIGMMRGGSGQVTLGAVDLTRTNSCLAQIAAETFGLPLERVRVWTAPSNVAPHSGGTGGSTILYTLANAVILAARDAQAQVLALAAGE